MFVNLFDTTVKNNHINDKIKFSLVLIKHHAIKTYGAWRYDSTLAPAGVEWSGSRPYRLIPG
jgi:hypothetical protein